MNGYNQVPHLIQDTTWESDKHTIRHYKQKLGSQPFTSRCSQGSNKQTLAKALQTQDRNNTNDPQKKHRLGPVSKSILLEVLNRFHSAPTSPLVQMWIKTHRYLFCIKDP